MLEVVASALAFIAWVIVLIDAFKTSNVEGLLCLLIPFYSLYYLIRKQTANKGAVFGLLAVSMVAGVASQTSLFASKGLCDRATQAEVEQAFGATFASMSGGSGPRGDACVFSTEDSPAKELVVFYSSNCESGSVKAAIQRGGRDIFSVSEVGESAVSKGPDLWVQQGEVCLIISYDSEDTDYHSSLEARKRVASLYLSKLKK